MLNRACRLGWPLRPRREPAILDVDDGCGECVLIKPLLHDAEVQQRRNPARRGELKGEDVAHTEHSHLYAACRLVLKGIGSKCIDARYRSEPCKTCQDENRRAKLLGESARKIGVENDLHGQVSFSSPSRLWISAVPITTVN